MDIYLKTVKEIQELAGFDGTQKDFAGSKGFLPFLSKNKLIPSNLKKGDMTKERRNLYIDFLVSLSEEFINKHDISSWDEFKAHKDNKKSWKLLFDFGVRGELQFNEVEEIVEEEPLTKLTFREFYELCQIQFHYDGSFGSFKKMISKKYGSFAEYCLDRGYDINNTKWENDETALRVAQKIGSLTDVKKKSSSLYNYLLDKKLDKKVA